MVTAAAGVELGPALEPDDLAAAVVCTQLLLAHPGLDLEGAYVAGRAPDALVRTLHADLGVLVRDEVRGAGRWEGVCAIGCEVCVWLCGCEGCGSAGGCVCLGAIVWEVCVCVRGA